MPFERAGDLTREVDLIEEVGRVHGLDDIPAELPRLVGPRSAHAGAGAASSASRGSAADLGLCEAITYHLVPEADLDARCMIADGRPAPRRWCGWPTR